MIIIFEGPDKSGKSNIAIELSNRIKFFYYKYQVEIDKISNKDYNYFYNCLQYGYDYSVDFMTKLNPNIILDRSYPSEYVYSQIINRPTNLFLLKKYDKKFAKAGTKIIYCYKTKYDEKDEYISPKLHKKLKGVYDEFKNFTKCDIFSLDTTDNNLNKQIEKILNFLKIEKN